MISLKLAGNIGLLEGFINGLLFKLNHAQSTVVEKKDLEYMKQILKTINDLVEQLKKERK